MITIRTWQIVGAVGFLGVIIAAFLPWARVGFISATGMDVDDGFITLALGVAGLLVILLGRGTLLILLAFALAAGAILVGVYDTLHVMNSSTENEILGTIHPEVGSGLILTIGAGILAAIASLIHLDSAGQDPPPVPRW